ncbi:MAG: hypothetical protein ACOH2A_07370 [Sphingobacteriaceae bacterium]
MAIRQLLAILSLLTGEGTYGQHLIDSIKWDQTIIVNNPPLYNDIEKATENGKTSGYFKNKYRSQYTRLLKLKN